MGLSSNQARFLTLTSRQCDLEHRVQQICQRRLRLTAELERIASKYNTKISQRGLFINPFASVRHKTERISVENLKELGYYVYDTQNNKKVGFDATYDVVGKNIRQIKRVERDAMSDPIAYGTTLPTGTPTITQKGAESVEAMNTIVTNANLSDTDLKVISYQNVNQNGELETINAIAIRSQEGFDAIMTLLKNKDEEALKQNYILDLNEDLEETIDMSSFTGWTGIENFSGTFDGNFYTIKNLEGSQGLFKSASGTIQNTYLDGVTLSGGDAEGVGSLVGVLQNGGTVVGCQATDINLRFQTSNGLNGVGNGLGGLVGRMDTNSTVDRSNASGEIHMTGDNPVGYQYYHSIGGLVGRGSGSSLTKSSADVDIFVPNDWTTANSCIGTFLAHDGTDLNIENCYATGSIKRENDVPILTVGGVNAGLGHWSAGKDGEATASTTFAKAPDGTTKYWNGDDTNLSFTSASSTCNTEDFRNQVIVLEDGTELPIWNFDENGNPTSLNIDAINTIETDKYGYIETFDPNLITDEYKGEALEEGIRNGTIILLQDADINSQDTVTIWDKQYETNIDWRTLSCINDELLRKEMAEAETIYESNISLINAQDKKLLMEQSSLEVEYKAILSEKEAVKKILDTNAQASFKYFS